MLVMKDFTERWPIGAWEKGLMSKSIVSMRSMECTLLTLIDSLAAMLELGCLLGAIITGTFADHLTRRQAIVLACSTCDPPRGNNDAL